MVIASVSAPAGEAGVTIMTTAEEEEGGEWEWAEVDADGVYVVDLRASRAPRRVCGWPAFAFNRDVSGASHGIGEARAQARAELRRKLHEAVRLRVSNIPCPPPLVDSYTDSDSDSAVAQERVAVLFSGGIDCTLLACLIHDVLPPTEPVALVNVAFENPRSVEAYAKTMKTNGHSPDAPSSAYDRCPDRLTGLSSFAELQRVAPQRTWKLICVNVPYAEFLAHKDQVASLMHPHNTEMDLSIAIALYFAARGQGVLFGDDTQKPYTTPARVLISGLGADELFGGYTRHATAFTRNGASGLVEELELDILRIGKRNLGRDDRVISHWAREVRFPFLDESVVSWALALPWWQKCSFGMETPTEDGTCLEPGKHILRLLAVELLMPGVAREKKRAIQFGARTAKMTSGKTKGTQSVLG